MAAITGVRLDSKLSWESSTQIHLTAALAAENVRDAPRNKCFAANGSVKLQSLSTSKLPWSSKWKGKQAPWKVSAVATDAVGVHTPLYDPVYRLKVAEEHGFTHVGEPLPSNVTLKNILDTFPPEVYEIQEWKGWRHLAISVTAYTAGLYMLAHSPWYLLPFGWAWTGTALLGFFCIGHECGHKTFCSNKVIEDIIGTLMMLPLVFPYEAWRIKHDRHHAKTNLIGEDTAWHPVVKEDYKNFKSSEQLLVRLILGPFRPLASIAHWIDRHFFLDKFRPSERERVKLSLACVYSFMMIGWPLIIHQTGMTGWVNFWLMPWLAYHFWMSTITMIHHTAPHILFSNARHWNPVQSQLCGTVHCDYPKWVDMLIHDINVHIPHHITQKIPSYNLKLAHKSLQQNWGKHLNETRLSWRLMKSIMTTCHLYDERKCYVPFDEGNNEKSPMITAIRKVMPNTP